MKTDLLNICEERVGVLMYFWTMESHYIALNSINKGPINLLSSKFKL